MSLSAPWLNHSFAEYRGLKVRSAHMGCSISFIGKSRHTHEFKKKRVMMEILKEERSIAEIAVDHGVYPTQRKRSNS